MNKQLPGKPVQQWGVEQTTCKSCPHQTEQPVTLHPRAIRQIQLLVEQTRDEWLAYLDGETHDDGSIWVTNLRVPPQQASGGHVDVDEYIESDTHVGVMHSHHTLGMKAFSHTDETYINGNHSLSLLINNDKASPFGFVVQGDYKRPVPCGIQMVVPAKVVFAQYVLEGERDWIGGAKALIRKFVPATMVRQSQQNGQVKIYSAGKELSYNEWKQSDAARAFLAEHGWNE